MWLFQEARELERQLEERRQNGQNQFFSQPWSWHDEGDKDYKKEKVEAYKEGKIDFIIVYSMLSLTGFDALASNALSRA